MPNDDKMHYMKYEGPEYESANKVIDAKNALVDADNFTASVQKQAAGLGSGGHVTGQSMAQAHGADHTGGIKQPQ